MELVPSIIGQFKQENDTLRTENEELKKRIIQLENQLCQQLELKLLSNNSQSIYFNKEFSNNTEEDITVLQETNTQLKDHICELQNEIQNLTKILEEQLPSENNEYIIDLKAVSNTFEQQLLELRKEVQRLTDPDLKYNQEIKQLYETIKQLQKEIDDVYNINDNPEFINLKQLIVQQEHEIEILNKKINQVKLLLQESQNMLKIPLDERTRIFVESIKQQNEDLNSENAFLKKCIMSTSPTDEKEALKQLETETGKKKIACKIQ